MENVPISGFNTAQMAKLVLKFDHEISLNSNSRRWARPTWTKCWNISPRSPESAPTRSSKAFSLGIQNYINFISAKIAECRDRAKILNENTWFFQVHDHERVGSAKEPMGATQVGRHRAQEDRGGPQVRWKILLNSINSNMRWLLQFTVRLNTAIKVFVKYEFWYRLHKIPVLTIFSNVYLCY